MIILRLAARLQCAARKQLLRLTRRLARVGAVALAVGVTLVVLDALLLGDRKRPTDR